VIFKQCEIDGRPTMKVSSTPSKSTLPGVLQVFRGADARGMYVADVIGLEGEQVSIPGAVTVEPLLRAFWDRGYHEPIESIPNLKAWVDEQRGRFEDLAAYPVSVSTALAELRDSVTAAMRVEPNDWRSLVVVPEELELELEPIGG
jgi:hypothetical protein